MENKQRRKKIEKSHQKSIFGEREKKEEKWRNTTIHISGRAGVNEGGEKRSSGPTVETTENKVRDFSLVF